MASSALIEVWPRLPGAVRRPVASLVGRLKMRDRLLSWATRRSLPEGFLTLTPDTPPAIDLAMRRIAESGLSGNYYEFGLFRGYTFWHAQRSARKLRLSQMHFYGFDSFRGLPSVTGIDAVSDEFKKGDYASTLAQVRRNLDANGVEWNSTHLIEGYFDDSLPPFREGPGISRAVALALIDCDLYSSTVPVLKFLATRLQEGSILMFDDWNCFKASDQFGERRAFHEFLAAHKQWFAEPFVSFGWHGQAFIMRSTD